MPVYGDDIVGYISKGNGITIHRKNCHNIFEGNDRLIHVDWNEKLNKKYITNVLIYADKKDDLLANIITKTTSMGIGVKSVNTILNNDIYIFDLNVLVTDNEVLDKYIAAISNVAGVSEVQRGNK